MKMDSKWHFTISYRRKWRSAATDAKVFDLKALSPLAQVLLGLSPFERMAWQAPKVPCKYLTRTPVDGWPLPCSFLRLPSSRGSSMYHKAYRKVGCMYSAPDEPSAHDGAMRFQGPIPSYRFQRMHPRWACSLVPSSPFSDLGHGIRSVTDVFVVEWDRSLQRPL